MLRSRLDFLSQLDLSTGNQVLDVGCGLGGAARFVADRYRSRVTGIDLTAEFVEVGRTLNAWVGLDDRVELHQGSTLAMSFEPGSFDKGYMLHVGMNIADKTALFTEIYRLMRPGALFGVYDIMRTGPGELSYPVPWASSAEQSTLSSPEQYKQAFRNAGFVVTAERNRRDFAQQFFAELRAKTAAAGGPPPLGLHLVMGENAAVKVKNMVENITAGRIAPVEIIVCKVP